MPEARKGLALGHTPVGWPVAISSIIALTLAGGACSVPDAKVQLKGGALGGADYGGSSGAPRGGTAGARTAGSGGASIISGIGQAAGNGGAPAIPPALGGNTGTNTPPVTSNAGASGSSGSAACDANCNSICRSGTCVVPQSIAAGGAHTCVILAGGTVECWGGNAFGELGNGSVSALGEVTPTPVVGLTGVTALALGSTFTCALTGSGLVKCWGSNSAGQLGDGTQSNAVSPVTVLGVTGAKGIAAGYDFACAVLDNGSALCWGNNTAGQLGIGSTSAWSAPVPVTGLTDVQQIVAGYDSACALRTNGQAACWGTNLDGQLGRGSLLPSLVPVAVVNLEGATRLAGASDFLSNSVFEADQVGGSVCALVAGGAAQCWGGNLSGQLGRGTATGSSSKPFAVQALVSATSLVAGSKFYCARLADGTARCWGSNVAGQLGNGTESNAAAPVPVSGLCAVDQIAAGAQHACSLHTDGTVKCWGMNMRKELGAPLMETAARPVVVEAFRGKQEGNGDGCPPITEGGGAGGNGGLLGGTGGTGSGGASGTGTSGNSSGGSGTSGAGTSGAGTSGAGTSGAGTSGAGTSGAGTSGAGTNGAGTSGAGTSGNGSGGTDGAAPPRCQDEGKVECQDRFALRTCRSGFWATTPCDNFNVCSATACRPGCPELVTTVDEESLCYMPTDPYEESGLTGTLRILSTAPEQITTIDNWISTWDTLDNRDGNDDTLASVAPEPSLGVVWHAPLGTAATNRLYIWGYLGVDQFLATYGASPSSITLRVKMRKTAANKTISPYPLFYLENGSPSYVTKEDAAADFSPTEQWAVYSREFSAEEITALSTPGDDIVGLDFYGHFSTSSQETDIPGEPVDIAWFAVTYGLPKQ